MSAWDDATRYNDQSRREMDGLRAQRNDALRENERLRELVRLLPAPTKLNAFVTPGLLDLYREVTQEATNR